MEILYMLIPMAVFIMIIAIVAFAWTVKSGQYDDLEGPAYRILMDDDDPLIPRSARPPEDTGEPEPERTGDEERPPSP